MASQRMRRVDGSVREVLASALASEVTDPGLGFVTVTSVETSGDLRHAKVFISALGDADEQQASLDAVNRAKRLLQSSIARALRLKYTPILEFQLDDTARRAVRLDALLSDPADGRAVPGRGDDPLTRRRADEGGS